MRESAGELLRVFLQLLRPLSAVAAMAVAIATPGVTDASKVRFILSLDPTTPGCVDCTLSGPGTYDIFVSDSVGDNFGLGGFAISVQNATTTINRSPQALDVDDGFGTTNPAGFTLLRGVAPSGTGFIIEGAQDVLRPTPYLIYGFGQSPNSFAASLPAGATPTTTDQSTWAAKLLIAEGTYTPGAKPFFNFADATDVALVFSEQAPNALVPAQIVPEPSTAALLVIGCVAALVARRRTVELRASHTS
jgi:hypothetical protein